MATKKKKSAKKKQVKPKAKTAAILSGDDAYDRTIADTFEATGGSLRGLTCSARLVRNFFTISASLE